MRNVVSKISIAVVFMIAAVTVQAQTIQDGLKAITFGKAQSGLATIEAIVKSNPNSQENNFWLGHAYNLTEKTSDASAAYQKAASIDPKSPMGQVAQGRVELLKKNYAEGKKLFDAAVKATRSKDAEVLRMAGESYLFIDKAELENGLAYLNKAVEVNGKSYAANMALGDALRMKRESGPAVSRYETAEVLDPKNPYPTYKIGTVFFNSKNEEKFKTSMESAIAKDASFPLAYKELGDFYYNSDMMKKALEYYVPYMKVADLTVEDRIQYANTLFLAKDYKASIDAVNEVLKLDSKYNYLNRLIGYSYFETGDHAQAMSFMEKFLQEQPADKILASDYEYYGKALSKNGKDSSAIVQYKKCMEMDPKKVELNGNIAEALYKSKKYAEAARYYETKIKSVASPSALDYYGLGTSYFYSQQYGKADTAFTKITEISPTKATGWVWRAKCNAKSDPDVEADPTTAATFGLAKPYYEKFVEIASADKEKFKKDLIEAYQYLGYYGMVKQDKEYAKSQFSKILEVDPTNQNAMDALASLNK